MKAKAKVCILSSGHPPYEGRVFEKEAKSLLKAGYEVVFVAPHTADEVLDGITVRAVPGFESLFRRALITAPLAFKASLREKADVYHFHDPELLPAGLLLKLLGNRVIYDVHEYNKQNFMSRQPGYWGLRKLIANVFDFFETLSSRIFNGVVVVDKVIEAKFKGRAVMVSNFPGRPVNPVRTKKSGGEFKCVYAGGIIADRGLFKMVEAMEHVERPARLILLGELSPEDRRKAEEMKGYERVDYRGYRPWQEVLSLLPECDLGLVLLQPVPAYMLAGEGTVKLFEYMGSGIPVLGSALPNLKRIIEREDCGLTVDSTDPVEIARKITYFIDNPEAARRMGENGRKAVMEKYNWEIEAGKLIGLYSRILGKARTGDAKLSNS